MHQSISDYVQVHKQKIFLYILWSPIARVHEKVMQPREYWVYLINMRWVLLPDIMICNEARELKLSQ